ncbi:MAG: hypothetical protein QOG46_2069 [Pseudonocardiales bacterium]|nr:hypothetical protein [Pseudonocardiales bacterium]
MGGVVLIVGSLVGFVLGLLGRGADRYVRAEPVSLQISDQRIKPTPHLAGKIATR